MKQLLLFFILLISSFLKAQERQTDGIKKLSATLKMFLNSEQRDNRFVEFKNGLEYTPLFLEVFDTSNIQALRNEGVILRTKAGTIFTADVPFNKILQIASLGQVKRLELPLLFKISSDSLMKKYTTVNRVLSGDLPLTQPYTGKGVMIGIIDDGIEFGHPYFLDSSGKTIIDGIWNMGPPGNPPTGFTYGTYFNKDSLNSIIATSYNSGTIYERQLKYGAAMHGTPVASLAGGKFGVAPGTTLVGVSAPLFLDSLLRGDFVLDAISFIYSRAEALGMKCIINMSFGSQWGGPHDGKTIVERAIDSFSLGKADLLLCSSAGNDGNNWKHWGGVPIHPDSSFGFARFAYSGSMYFSIPKQYSSVQKISITDTRSPDLNNPKTHRDSILYQTPFFKIDSLIQIGVPVICTSYLKNGSPSAVFTFSAANYNDDYDELIVDFKELTSQNNFDSHISRFIFKGNGIVHGYFPFLNLHPLYFFQSNPFPNNPTYISTDRDYSTGIPTHAYSVFSSGAYNIRNCFLNKIQNKVFNYYPVCQLTYFTSRGPTFDGRIKPDIITPGENVIAARSRWDDYYGHHFTVDTQYVMFGGTSASSPITAGIAALIWEKFPNYTSDSVKAKIKSSAYSDSHTGQVPNNVAGWGKADAFKALTGISTPAVFNCESLFCEAIIIPVPPPPPPTPRPNSEIFIFPNPSQGSISIRYISLVELEATLLNSIGQVVYRSRLAGTTTFKTLSLHIDNLATGLYFFKFSGYNYGTMKPLLIQ